MHTHTAVALALALVTSTAALAAAQSTYAPAESAAVARAAWAEARTARAEKRYGDAVIHARRAHESWPGQWVYAYGLASIGALAQDTTATTEGLGDLLALGAAPDLSRDTTLVRFARANASAAARLAALEKELAGTTEQSVAIRFPPGDSTFWPEGIAADTTRQELYVTGVREGRVARVDSSGGIHAFARIASSGWAALGIGYDAKHDRIWVGGAAIPQAAGYAAADSGRGAIVAFDRASGREVARHELPASPAGHVPGDVLVAPSGDVYVSDSGEPVIWRIRDGKLERFATDPGFRSLQGQAIDPAGRWLYIADYSHGLAAVDLTTRAVIWLRPPNRASLLGIDGLAQHPSMGLLAVQNGIVPPRLLSIETAERGGVPRILTVDPLGRADARADEPTLIAVTGHPVGWKTIYIGNSQWEKYDAAGNRVPGTVLEPPLLFSTPYLMRIRCGFGDPMPR